MKKIVILFFVFALTFLFIKSKPINKDISLGDSSFKTGDVNGDGKVGSLDYILIKKHILNNPKLTGEELKRADVNNDGRVSSLDYITVKKIIINGDNVVNVSTPNPTPVPTTKPTATPTSAPSINKIHFINTGNSNAFLIESNNHYALVDASDSYNEGTTWDNPNPTYSVDHVKKYLNQVGVKRLDVVIASHSHSDHIGGMKQIAENYVDKNTTYYYRTYVKTSDDILYPDWENEKYYKRSVDAMRKAGATLNDVTGKSISFKLGDFDIRILNTDTPRSNELYTSGNSKYAYGENKNSLAVYVKLGDAKVLLAGDMEIEDELDVANTVGEVDILQMGHHGSYTSTQPAFAKKVKPNYVIIQTDNFGFDSTYLRFSSIRLMQKNGAKLYVPSKVKDAIVATCDSKKCSINSEDGLIKFSVTAQDSWEKLTYGGKSIWLYFDKSNPVELDWVLYDKKYYYLDKRGVMVTEWQQITWRKGTNWFYFDSSGAMVTGWKKIKWSGGTNWFYFDPVDGYMYANTTKTIDGKSYTFNSNGVCTSSGC